MKQAGVCHIRFYCGLVVKHAAFFCSGASDFEKFTVRTLAKKVTYVKGSIPANSGYLPHNRTLLNRIK